MAILTVTPTINATTGAITYTASNPSSGDIITGVVLRDFMTNGPTKKADGTYETDAAKLVFDVKVRPNSFTAVMTITKGSVDYPIIMLKAPEGLQQEYKWATGDVIKVNPVVAALITNG
tara:strand:- start:466 stop:822 length:357 start_codon:yes stop_codon:yes gene_type:complete